MDDAEVVLDQRPVFTLWRLVTECPVDAKGQQKEARTLWIFQAEGGEVTREPGGVRILGSPSLQRLQVGPGGCDVRGEPLALGYSSLRRGSERGSELGSLLVGSLERRGGRGSLAVCCPMHR